MKQRIPWFFVDLDGTLIDNLHLLRSIFFHFGQTFGIRLTEKDFDYCNGPSMREIVRYLKKKGKLSYSLKHLENLYKATFKNIYQKSKPRPDARRVLKGLRAQGWKCALVTSASKNFATSFLEANKMGDLFEFVVSGDDVRQAKPNPAIYTYAKQKSKGNCFLVLEDSHNGIRSGKEAGCVALRLGDTRPKEFFSVRSFSELGDRLHLVDGFPFLTGSSTEITFFVRPGNQREIPLYVSTQARRLWLKAKKRNPTLYDGAAFAAEREEAPYSFSGDFIPYRYIYYQLITKNDIGMIPCGITGIVRWRKKFILLARSARVSSYAKRYEFAPAGAIDHDALVGERGRIDLKQQLLKELGEELMLSPSAIRSSLFYGLVFDIKERVLDAVYLVTLKDNVRPRVGSEHTAIQMFTFSSLKRIIILRPQKYTPFVKLFIRTYAIHSYNR